MQPGDHLKYTGGNEAILYSRNWERSETCTVDPAILSLTHGKHSLTVTGNSEEPGKSTLHVEIRFLGQPELLPSEDAD